MLKSFTKIVYHKSILAIGLVAYLIINGCGYSFNVPKEWPTYSLTTDQIKQYMIDNKNILDKIEGIWNINADIVMAGSSGTKRMSVANQYTVAILKKDLVEKNEFVMIIIGSGPDLWQFPGRVKGIFKRTAYKNLYEGVYYNLDYKAVSCRYKFEDDGTITTALNYSPADLPRASVSENLMFLKTYPEFGESEAPIETKSSGTGFLLNQEGYLITCAHVIENHKNIKVHVKKDYIDKVLIASIINIDQNNDIAVLKIDLTPYKGDFGNIPVSISDKILDVGEKIYSLGYPLPGTMGEELKLTDGIISSTKGFQSNINYYQVSCAIQPGNSGGPLIDDDGNVVGVINAKHLGTENVNYALKSYVLYNMLKLSFPNTNILIRTSLKGKTLQEKYKILKDYIFLIEAE